MPVRSSRRQSIDSNGITGCGNEKLVGYGATTGVARIGGVVTRAGSIGVAVFRGVAVSTVGGGDTSREIDAGRTGVIASPDDLETSLDFTSVGRGSFLSATGFAALRFNGFGAGSDVVGIAIGTKSPALIELGVDATGEGATTTGCAAAPRVAGSRSVPFEA